MNLSSAWLPKLVPTDEGPAADEDGVPDREVEPSLEPGFVHWRVPHWQLDPTHEPSIFGHNHTTWNTN